MHPVITPELVLRAYISGAFPMHIPDEEDQIYWLSPDPRGIIPLERFHLPRSVRRLLSDGRFTTTTDQEFDRVIRGCAGRSETWISSEIVRLYTALHEQGFAHSIEVWEGEALVGGLYGVALRGAFFGESMYNEVPNASKVALVDLVSRLRRGNFRLLDTQYLTPHLALFGATEVDRVDFLRLLQDALTVQSTWSAGSGPYPNKW
jgi:leucyl/phenylalanyl-tRNA--protein transferase